MRRWKQSRETTVVLYLYFYSSHFCVQVEHFIIQLKAVHVIWSLPLSLKISLTAGRSQDKSRQVKTNLEFFGWADPPCDCEAAGWLQPHNEPRVVWITARNSEKGKQWLCSFLTVYIQQWVKHLNCSTLRQLFYFITTFIIKLEWNLKDRFSQISMFITNRTSVTGTQKGTTNMGSPPRTLPLGFCHGCC